MTGTAFSIHPHDFGTDDAVALRRHVADRTRSEVETESIIRSIERYGIDRSIRYFEVTPAEGRPGVRSIRSTSWNVRAVRF